MHKSATLGVQTVCDLAEKRVGSSLRNFSIISLLHFHNLLLFLSFTQGAELGHSRLVCIDEIIIAVNFLLTIPRLQAVDLLL